MNDSLDKDKSVLSDWQPLSDENLWDEVKILQRYYTWRCNEALRYFANLRKTIGDAFITLEVVVLEPVCSNCRPIWSAPASPNKETVLLWPDEVPKMFRTYDSSSRQVAIWLDKKNAKLRWSLQCQICSERFTNVQEQNLMPVVEHPFSHYYDLEEEGLDRFPSKTLRRDIIKFYGKKCLQCKRFLSSKDITIDHIVAYNGGEGPTIATNLQVLCKKCNEEKANLRVQTVKFVLDFPIRPAPSDSYEGIAW